MITYDAVVNDKAVQTYITEADAYLSALGYTEHSFVHVAQTATTARYILNALGRTEREIELVSIAAHLHDIGNLVNRADHAQSGAVMAFQIMSRLGASPDDIATVVTAIGNHDENTAHVLNPISAALILGDKSDVRRSRVSNKDFHTFDIHDRVNYSVIDSKVTVNDEKTGISLRLTIDTRYCAIIDYFEIFLGRMLLCRKAADKLGLVFSLHINGQQLV